MHDFESQGYSLFETFVAVKGRFIDLQAHWRRLAHSAVALDLEAPDWPVFRDQVLSFHDHDQSQVMRYTLVREGGRWAADVPVRTGHRLHKRPLAGLVSTPVHLGLSALRLGCGDLMRCHKTGSRLAYQLGLQRARAEGFDDAVFLDAEDRVLETAISNVFVLVDQQWLTPPLALGLLPGLARARLLTAAPVTESIITLGQLNRARAAMVSNAVTGPRAVASLCGRGLATGPVETLLQSLKTTPLSCP